MSETVQAFTLYLLGTSILLRRNFARCMTVMAAGHRRKRTPVCGEEVPVRRSIQGTLGAQLTPVKAPALTHLLLVPVPVLHEALLLLSVPGGGRKEQKIVHLLGQMHRSDGVLEDGPG